jgi:hypothetical protein
MRNHRLATLLFAAAIATVSGLAVASPSQAAVSRPAAIGIYQIQSNLSFKCLQPVNGFQGSAIVQETCNGSVAQQWTLEASPYDSNADWFVNSSSGLCLDARGLDTDGTPIEQWTCDKISNERWTFNDGGSMANEQLVSMVAHTYDTCISTPGLANGDAMVLYAGTPPIPSEYWNLTAI